MFSLSIRKLTLLDYDCLEKGACRKLPNFLFHIRFFDYDLLAEAELGNGNQLGFLSFQGETDL